ncbi:MAG: hypothetical protein A3J74_05175 [Elusimicrobia bacterium RIFCSPHIGHO2_02_FULL_57_9]|nr:MAG: hypothetical protein A3J74_05175 [Elusimicrobia bacterium RIFCSPHIGHO2_02_FULL_57_9]
MMIKKLETRESAALERTLIRKSMSRWEGMNSAGRELGRGLDRKELIDRVAKEVGQSIKKVLSALKKKI